MSGPAPVVDGGAAAAAPAGALHFGMALRARYGAPARRRPAAVAGLPFATLGRRMAPPVSAPRLADPGLAWRALGDAPLREEPAPAAAARPWRGALGQAPVPSAEVHGSAFVLAEADSPLPERLPGEPVLVQRDADAPFRPLPQAPVQRAASTPPAAAVAAEERRAADEGGSVGGGAPAPREVPVFPGLPERLVPAWVMGGGDGPASAGSHLPRVPSPAIPLPSAAAQGGRSEGPAMEGGMMPEAPLPLPGRTPNPAAPDRTGPEPAGETSGRTGADADAGMEGAPPLSWPLPAAPGAPDVEGWGGGDGERAAATPDARAFADAVGFTPLAWSTPAAGAAGGGESDASTEPPRLTWAEPGSGTEAGPAPAGPPGTELRAGGEPGPYAPTLLHGITLAAQSLATAVELRETVREARREAQEAARPAPAPAPPQAPAIDPTSDEVVRTLMRKMTAMAREERFRAGGLR